MASLSFSNEEKLAEEIREYPVLYDKGQKAYKDKQVTENAWKKVVEEVEFVEGVEGAKTFLSF